MMTLALNFIHRTPWFCRIFANQAKAQPHHCVISFMTPYEYEVLGISTAAAIPPGFRRRSKRERRGLIGHPWWTRRDHCKKFRTGRDVMGY
jgi:hypothetical protein